MNILTGPAIEAIEARASRTEGSIARPHTRVSNRRAGGMLFFLEAARVRLLDFEKHVTDTAATAAASSFASGIRMPLISKSCGIAFATISKNLLFS